jgi:hypothetical protein
MKRKLVTLGIAFLLCIGMVGAGFASWVVTNNVTKTVDGQISVESVVDARLDLTVEVAKDSDGQSLIFGGDGVTYVNPWLLYTGKTQDLTVDVTLTLNNYATLKAAVDAKEIGGVSLKVSLAEKGTAGNLATAVTNSYIVLPTNMSGENLTLASFTPVTETDKATATVTFTFAWGSAFANGNPLAKYNALPYSDSVATEAYNAWTGLIL